MRERCWKASAQQERLRRSDAEAALAMEQRARLQAEQAQVAEARQRVAAEARLEKMRHKVESLTKQLEDDEVLGIPWFSMAFPFNNGRFLA